MIGENFPYTNFHDLNLDWIIKELKTLNDKFDEAIASKIKIADPIAWDITKPYEQLTVVEYDNKMYISMQPVPPGTSITNTDYWEPIFDLETLYDMIEDLEEEVNDKIEDLDDITVKNNKAKHVLFLGDSYTVWNSSALYNSFVNHVGIPAAQIHNLAVAGASFGNAYGNTYNAQMEGYTGDKTKITDIIVAGGINDAWPEFDVSGYPNMDRVTVPMDAFVAYAHTNYPNARLHIAYIGGCLPRSSMYSTDHPAKSQEIALHLYTVPASLKGFNVLKTYNAIHSSPAYYSTDDYIHPNSAGSELLGNAVATTFNGQYYPVQRPDHSEGITYESTVIRQTTGQFSMSTVDDITNIIFPDAGLYMVSGASISSSFVEIADLAGRAFAIRTPVQIETMCLLNQFNDTDPYHPVPCSIKFANGKMYLKVNEIDNGAWKTFTATNQYASITILGYTVTTTTFNIN